MRGFDLKQLTLWYQGFLAYLRFRLHLKLVEEKNPSAQRHVIKQRRLASRSLVEEVVAWIPVEGEQILENEGSNYNANEESGHNRNEEFDQHANEESDHKRNAEFEKPEEVIEILPNEQPDQGEEGWILQSIGKKWRGFKAACKAEYCDPASPMATQIAHRPPRVLNDQWKQLLEY
ncbi:hypothetical protein M9H77_16320 [Catharanthus roseus]|uniref:Uncharacterized protein n=1 Tax=Catharanthus roseus TaxID=4058 RepID=A0ACC0B1G5_CATRO|nr:hypothetical protein M9H77_16320 [Catharanthus roseus]